MPSNTEWIEFRPHRKELNKVLGDLEADIMETLWNLQSASVKEIHKGVSQIRKVAITTVATVLDRLYEKGLVERELEKGKGLHYRYQPAITKKQFERNVTKAILEGLFTTFGDSALSYLADQAKITDKKVLREVKRHFERLKGS